MTKTVLLSAAQARPRLLRRFQGGLPWAWWQLLVLALVVLYGAENRQQFVQVEQASGRLNNVWDHVIVVLGSPYLWLFGLAPVWLVWSALTVVHEAEWSFLARSGSHVRWLPWTVASAARRCLLVCLGLIAAGAATGSGLAWGMGWSQLAQSTDLADTYSAEFVAELAWWSSTGLVPVVAVVAQLVWVSLSLLGWHAVLGMVHLWLRRPALTLATAIGMWCWVVLAFKLPDVTPVFSPHHGLSLARAVHEAGPIGAGVVLTLPWLVAFVGTAALDWRSSSPRLALAAVSPRAWLGVLGAAGVVAAALVSGPGDVVTTVVGILYGAGPDGTTLMLYLLNVVLVMGPVYLFAADLEAWKACLPVIVLRQGSYLGWFAQLLRPWLWRAPVVMAGWVVLTSLTMIARGAVWDAGSTPLVGPALYQWLVNGSLQLLVAIVIVFAASWLSGHEHASLLALVMMVALGFPASNLGRVLPFGLSGAGWALGGWPTMLSITLQLGGWLVLLVALCVTVLGHPRLKLNERNLA